MKALVEQIVRGSCWSLPFPVNRTERLVRLAHPRQDPVPTTPGLYRIHMAGVAPLAYVGQTKNLRRRVNELRGIYDPAMPFTDPHIASPCLWAYARMPDQRPYSISFLEVAKSTAYIRQGLEDLVIALARAQSKPLDFSDPQGRAAYSPLANYHRMPLGWISSSTRASGVRGGKAPALLTATPDAAREERYGWMASLVPITDLSDARDPIQDRYWGGHEWSEWSDPHTVLVEPGAQGLYRVQRAADQTLLFLGRGELVEAAKAVAADARRDGHERLVSWVAGPWTASEQRELRSDLLGLYLRQTGTLPEQQYGGERNEHAGAEQPFLWLLRVAQALPRLLPYRPPVLAIA